MRTADNFNDETATWIRRRERIERDVSTAVLMSGLVVYLPRYSAFDLAGTEPNAIDAEERRLMLRARRRGLQQLSFCARGREGDVLMVMWFREEHGDLRTSDLAAWRQIIDAPDGLLDPTKGHAEQIASIDVRALWGRHTSSRFEIFDLLAYRDEGI